MLLHPDRPIGQNITDIITTLNHERMLFQLPVMLCLVVIMAASLLGNSLVVCVYKSKYKKRTSSYFIVVLAIVDLCSALCIPFVVFDLANPFKYPVPVMCKINRFIESVANTGSGFILLCIAFDRYFHVCYPLRVYSIKQAQSLSIVMLTMSACLSWPILFLGGKKTVTTSVPGVFGEDCSYRDGMYNSIYVVLYLGVLFLAFFITLCLFIVFYGRIFYVIYKRKHTMIGEKCFITQRETAFAKRKHKTERILHNSPNDNIFVIEDAHNTIPSHKNIQTKQKSNSYQHIPKKVDDVNFDITVVDDNDEEENTLDSNHYIPNGLDNINLNVINDCDGVKTLEICRHIPNGLDNINLNVINDCDEEQMSETNQQIPSGLNNINLDVINDCDEEKTLESCSHIPNGLNKIDLEVNNDYDEEKTLESCSHIPNGLNNIDLEVNNDYDEEKMLESCNHIPNGLNNIDLEVNNEFDETNSKSLPEPKTKNVRVDKETSIKTLPVRAEKKNKRMGKMQIRTTRTTVILAIVTLTGVVGYLPYLTVSLMINFGKHFQPGMSVWEDLAYEFCTKSYFLNSAVNPIIYSVMNPVFRRESQVLLKNIANVFRRK